MLKLTVRQEMTYRRLSGIMTWISTRCYVAGCSGTGSLSTFSLQELIHFIGSIGSAIVCRFITSVALCNMIILDFDIRIVEHVSV